MLASAAVGTLPTRRRRTPRNPKHVDPLHGMHTERLGGPRRKASGDGALADEVATSRPGRTPTHGASYDTGATMYIDGGRVPRACTTDARQPPCLNSPRRDSTMALSTQRRARAALTLALLLAAATAAMSHDTVLPHHVEDVEDLTHARNVRGLALVITIGFVVVLATVIVLATRYAPEDPSGADLREEQERLKAALLAAAEEAKASIAADDDALAWTITAAYAAAAGYDMPQGMSANAIRVLGDGQTFGEDTLTARRTEAGKGIELTATTATAGARVRIGADGSYSVTVFAVATQSSAGEGQWQ